MVILRTPSPSDVVAVYQKGNLGGKLAFIFVYFEAKILANSKTCLQEVKYTFWSYKRVVLKKVVLKKLRKANTGIAKHFSC